MSFWGLILEPKKSYTQRGVEQPFHISSAALDLQTADGPVSVVCRKSDQDFILCSLSKEQGIFNVPLNLDFEIGSEINFHVIGDSAVHLTGYIVDEMEMDDDSSLDELEEEEEEAESKPLLKNTKKLLDAAAAKRKPETKVQNVSKKAKVEAVLEDDDDDDEDDSDFEAEDSVEGEEVLGEEEEDDDDDDDDDDEDDDDDDDEDDDEDDEENDAEAAEILKKLQSMKGNKSNQPNQPAAKGSPNKGDKNAKQGKKDQANNQQKNQPNNQQKNQPNKQNGTSTQSNGVQKKVLAGGVQIEDTQLGNGMVASNGKQVTMYYVGRLKQTNKQFDSCTSGSGFKFRLGRGEVIKGWDIGVAGMQVGGKRRLTIPAKMAYGKEGAGKTIPPNSTLVFDVELRQVK